MAIYMSLGSAQGDVTAQSNQGWIELLDCSWGMSRRIRSAVGVGKSRESTTPYVGEIAVTKYVDSASSTIQQYAFKAIVNDATLQYVHTDIGGGKVFRSLQLANCIISSVNSDGGSQERPKEYLTLNFTEITVSDMVYTDKDSEGTQSNVVYSLEQSTTL
jgi:type VI secretion system secreted protein Hcp